MSACNDMILCGGRATARPYNGPDLYQKHVMAFIMGIRIYGLAAVHPLTDRDR
jgi:hypothetical protein